jgi:hypothetical protein
VKSADDKQPEIETPKKKLANNMTDYFDYDARNGQHDVVTQEDCERWLDLKRKEQDRQKKAGMTEEELADPLFDVPY